MPDVVESEAVQLRRIVADERKALAQVVANIFLAAITAVGAYFMARMDSRVEAVGEKADAVANDTANRLRWTQEQQYQTRLEVRALTEDRAGGPWTGKAPPPPPPK